MLRPMVISMLTIGGLFFALFLIVEWKVSPLPMMPRTCISLARSQLIVLVYIFKNGAVSSILVQNFFFGIIFYGYLYYLPLYCKS
jgi:hypothetical protein